MSWIEKRFHLLSHRHRPLNTVQILGEINLLARAVGAKMWSLYVFTGRCRFSAGAAKRQPVPVFVFTRPKVCIFAPQGRLIAPICEGQENVGPLGRLNAREWITAVPTREN